jgi:hypothetical protein
MPDTSFMLALVLQSALLPFALALVVLLALRRPAPAIAVGFLASYFAVFHAQWSALPKQALDWMPWIALAALAVVGWRKAPPRLSLRAALALGTSVAVVWPALASLGMASALILIVAGAALMLLGWSAVGAAQRPLAAPLLTLVAGGAGLALMIDSSQALGQLSGALAAALAACALLGLMRKRIGFDAAAAGIAVLLLGALLINAYLYAGFPLAYVGLLVAALLAEALVTVIGRASGPRTSIAAGVLTLLPVLLVLVLTLRVAQEAGGY